MSNTITGWKFIATATSASGVGKLNALRASFDEEMTKITLVFAGHNLFRPATQEGVAFRKRVKQIVSF